MGQKPIEAKVARRFAELVGFGCTQHEAARAVGIGASTGERLLTRPEYREIAECARRERSGISADLARVIEELLTAGDPSGAPNYPLRAKGAELALKYKDVLDSVLPDEVEQALLPGVFLVFPVAEDEPPKPATPEPAGAHAGQQTAQS
jgi:hypothetical protein